MTKPVKPTAILPILPLLAACPMQAVEFSGNVVAVQDGDTITVVHGERTVRVRLSGVDSPEKNQPFGSEARAFTERLVLDKTITVIEEGTDRYGRLVGRIVLSDGRKLNEEIVAAGLAWWYRPLGRYQGTLLTLQSEARTLRRGLWAAVEATPPWEWRKQMHRPARSAEARSERRDMRPSARSRRRSR